MNNVYQVLEWMKTNPVMVVCAIIALVSAGVFIHARQEASAFRDELSQRESDLSQIDGFSRTSVTAPGPEPDDAPLQLQMVANDGAIETLQQIYDDLEQEHHDIYREATRINSRGKEPMLEGLLPDPGPFQSRRFQARDAYAAAFEDLYEQLDAGGPASEAEMEELLEQEREVMYRQVGAGQLTEEQEEQLRDHKASRLFQFLREHGTNFRVYADPVSLDIRGDWMPGPFTVGEWAHSPNPTMVDIWEGQKQLWVQEDLVRAINLANDGDPEVDSVLTLPVKRLLSLEVVPGYIGNFDPVDEHMDEAAIEQLVGRLQNQAADRLPTDYSVSPTGRISNVIYDVRHAVMNVIVDSQQIPRLLNAIDEVNFMTVLGTRIYDIDEYEHLRQGYYYGAADVVHLELTIETLWLRSWTAGHLSREIAEERGESFDPGLMPNPVRTFLGLPPRMPEELRLPADSAPQPGPDLLETPELVPSEPEPEPDNVTPPAPRSGDLTPSDLEP